MTKNVKMVLLALATTAAVAVPLAGYAFAQTTPAAPTTTQSQNEQNEGPEGTEPNEVKIQGSIQLPAEQPGAEVPDAQEDAQYAKLAKISADQARQSAQAVVPGTVTSVKLDDEDGSLVYEVVIGKIEVLVDAGNGKVLHQATAEMDNEVGEQDEASN